MPFQINGVANRTTIADGNTWNHEHIALLGKCLVSPENASHAITRHLADYVVRFNICMCLCLWGGGRVVGYQYIYVYIYMCVCVYVCICVYAYVYVC